MNGEKVAGNSCVGEPPIGTIMAGGRCGDAVDVDADGGAIGRGERLVVDKETTVGDIDEKGAVGARKGINH